jgi:hypothetical protein
MDEDRGSPDDGRTGELDGRASESDGQASESDGVASEDEETVQRDLGLGHPLSPESGESGSDPTGSDTDQPDDGEGPEAGTFDPVADGEESTASRRDLLLGGVAGAVAASLGWAGVLGLGGGDGPDGAEGVAVDCVNAIADNDWAAAGALFHPESAFGQSDLTYEEHLREQQQFEAYSSIEPSIEGHYTFRHVTDTEQAAQSEGVSIGLFGTELDPEDIDETKLIIVVASVRRENLNQTEPQRDYLGDEPTVGFNVAAVRDAAGWQVAQLFGGTTV